MKKRTKLTLVIALAMLISLFAVLPAFAAASVNITKNAVEQSKIDIGNLDLTSYTRTHTITIDADALRAAEKLGETFQITMENITLRFAPEVFYTEDYLSAVNRGGFVQVKLEVQTKKSFDMGKYFFSGVNNNYMLAPRNTTLAGEILVSGVKVADLHQFAAPISFIQDYTEDWNSNFTGKKESGVTLAWYDLERKMTVGTPQWVRLDTQLDTAENIATAANIYASGIIVPIICPDLNNETNSAVPDEPSSIPSDFWAREDILAMQRAGIVPADIAAERLNRPIDRDEFVGYFVRTIGLAISTAGDNPFTDLSASNPYYGSILSAAEAGLVNGTGGNTFSPDASITRQEMAALFSRALARDGIVTDSSSERLEQMTDASRISDWAWEACAIAVNRGLITGYGGADGTRFAPESETTWAEAVVMLNRLRTV